jgi:cation transport ATPase
VENVFEKSILIEIGTQIKLAQNQEENTETGIQALCKKISSYFVKGVIFLSLLTMAVWSVLLFFNLVNVPMCDVCWII